MATRAQSSQQNVSLQPQPCFKPTPLVPRPGNRPAKPSATVREEDVEGLSVFISLVDEKREGEKEAGNTNPFDFIHRL